MDADRALGRLVRWRRLIPWLWLALSLSWAVVILVTDEVAWPLALWIAGTVGPLTLLQSPPKSRHAGVTEALDSTNEGETE